MYPCPTPARPFPRRSFLCCSSAFIKATVAADLIKTEERISYIEERTSKIDEEMALPEICSNSVKLQELQKEKDSKVEFQLNASKKISIEVDVFMCAIRNLIVTLMLKDDSLEEMFKVRIKNECNYYKVDPDKFCLDLGFVRKIFFNKVQYSNYQGVLDKIHSEVKKVNELELLINSELTDDTRKQISSSMTELIEIFEEN